MSALHTCENLCANLGFSCESIDYAGGSVLALDTPFRFADGNAFTVYSEVIGVKVRFFDSSETLFHAMALGIRSFSAKGYQAIKGLVSKYGAEVSTSGEIELFCDANDTAAGFARYISSLLAIAEWEEQNAGLDLAPSRSSQLVEEAQLYLTALAPTTPAVVGTDRFRGISGRDYLFNLKQGDAHIDVIKAHPNAAATELHKLVDIRGKPISSEIEIIVVIDDRGHTKRGAEEVAVLGQFAGTWTMTKLMDAALPASSSRN
ncbi:DUF1828 domain-containing protein [Cupriavidus sp. IK-TO18]|uniref:DUF1828 domain-containing protein n=1 Tax=Cupriavidus sp. IK-TO18 TaxID=2782182 RepID=UPI001899A40E|nr:DUF1828 domain-containing protein [Cupriavidus sp. IK-TO18]MBF6987221.1 DUF1828 domain-containing protein [Cupriavidus sp. IK-TO18]